MKQLDIWDKIQSKLSSYQILVLGFAILIFTGTLLLMLPISSASGIALNFLDALFTATSAVCVTGLVVVDTGTHFSTFGQLVIITLIQLGGIGIMALTTMFALIIGKKIPLRERLVMQQALNHLSLQGVVKLTLYVVKATLLIEFIGGTILAIHWYQEFGLRGIYLGYWHAVSCFCNAGFDLFGNFSSFSKYVDDITVNLTICSLIVLGGIGFTVIADVWATRRFKQLQLHSKMVITTTLCLIIVGFLGIMLLEYTNEKTLSNLTISGKILASLFQSITPRTAGAATVDIGSMHDATLFFIVILMFIGASPASTGGGIKTSTFGIVAISIWSQMTGKNDAVIFDRQISAQTIYKAYTVIFISSLLVISVTMILSITENAPFINILFEVVSAFGTVGLSASLTTSLTPYGKIGIILTMFAGRVGPVTLALAIALRNKKQVIRYPEGKVLIG